MEHSKYWDLTTFQKAALSDEEIQAFRKVELMIMGVEAPVEPEVSAEPPSFHEFAKESGMVVNVVTFGYSGSYAVKEEDIEKILSCCGQNVNYKSINGSTVYFLEDGEKPKVESRVVYYNLPKLQSTYNELYGDSVKRKEAWKQYSAACEKAVKATRELTDDWESAIQQVALFNKIQKVFEEYVTMTEGDEELARKFLEKRFDSDDMQIYTDLTEEAGLS